MLYKERHFSLILFLILLVLAYSLDREKLSGFIFKGLPYREAGLLSGIVWGDKSGFDKAFYENLKRSGLIHLVVVSGSNVMLLAQTMIETMAGYLGRKRIILLTLIAVWWYAATAGWEIPVVRAALLVSVYYWSQLLGRKFDVFRSLGLVILLMVLGNRQVLKELSFWLSFTAFFGIISLNKVFRPELKKNFLLEEMKTIVWIGLLTTPVLALSLGQISLAAPVSNILVLALVELITIAGLAGSIVGNLIPVLGRIILWSVYPLLKFMAAVVEGMGSFGWAGLDFKFNWFIFTGWYLIILAAYLWRRHAQ